MKYKGSRIWIDVAGRLLLGYVLILSQGAWAAQGAKTGAKQLAATAAKAPVGQVARSDRAAAGKRSSHEGLNQGIKVHGHWTIEVRNPDGTLVIHREFENSLSGGGAFGGAGFLSNVLGRASTVGSYEIQMAGAVINSGGTESTVFIDEAGTPNAAASGLNCALTPTVSSCSTNLTVTVANGKLTLAGSVVIPPSFGSSVNSVATLAQTCNPTNTPQACPSTSTVTSYGFTNRLLDGINGDPAPVPVSPGQTAAVTVTISFS